MTASPPTQTGARPSAADPAQPVAQSTGPQSTGPQSAGRSGAVRTRGALGSRLNAWRKSSAFNPYWLSHRTLKASVAALAPSARGLLLDVGVAERPYGALFAPHVQRYIGLDYPPVLTDKQPALWQMLEQVRKTVDIFGDGRRLPILPDSVDTVLATEVLEHVPDPDRCLAEFHRVLRSGGRLLLTVPFQEPLHFLPQDYGRFTPGGLEHLLGQAGFAIERLEPRGNSTLALGAAAAQWLMRRFAAIRVQSDGSVQNSEVRMALLSPLIALLQLVALALSKGDKDGSQPLGYWVVAVRP